MATMESYPLSDGTMIYKVNGVKVSKSQYIKQKAITLIITAMIMGVMIYCVLFVGLKKTGFFFVADISGNIWTFLMKVFLNNMYSSRSLDFREFF